ncbi:MAG TPA: hypothetical protein VG893_10980 [Terracidiphilus sp.]|nr:hypothetical protein [Terracidiphilus sp.]
MIPLTPAMRPEGALTRLDSGSYGTGFEDRLGAKPLQYQAENPALRMIRARNELVHAELNVT